MASITAQELYEQYRTLDAEEREEFLRLVDVEVLNEAGEYVPTPEVREAIMRGLADLEAGRVVPGEKILAMLRR